MSAESTLLDRVYEAAIVPELWPDVLARIAKSANTYGGVLYAVTPRTAVDGTVSLAPIPRWIACETATPFVDRFVKDGWLQNNVRAARALQRNNGSFLSDHDLFSDDEIEKEPLYNYLRRQGVGWHTGLTIHAPSGDALIFNFERRLEEGPVTSKDIAGLNDIKGHLARSALLSARLGLEKAKTATEALAIVGLPAALLSPRFEILASNANFVELGLFAAKKPEKLQLRDASANQLLQNAFEQIDSGRYPSVNSIPIQASPTSSAAVAHVIPMRRSARGLFSPAKCAVVVTPVNRASWPAAEVIQGLFDLTSAEASIAIALVKGNTIEQIAASARKSSGTVRQQLKAVFQKTGVNRQADLVRLLANMSVSPGS